MLERSTDFGQSWTSTPDPASQPLHTFDWIEGTDEVWGATKQSGPFQSMNGGLDWTRYTMAPFSVQEDLSFVDAGTGWCVGSNPTGVGEIWRWYGTTGVEPVPVPVSLRVEVHPNPFERDEVFVSEAAAGAAPVEISIYDVLGRCLWRQEMGGTVAGPCRFHWDGRDSSGRPVSSGVYVYRFQTESSEMSGRLIRAR